MSVSVAYVDESEGVKVLEKCYEDLSKAYIPGVGDKIVVYVPKSDDHIQYVVEGVEAYIREASDDFTLFLRKL